VPTAAVGAALFAAGRGWGLLQLAGLRLSVAALLGFLVLDLVIYAQHVVFHKVPVLWRLHRMHHADLDVDVTTGGRFHPFEILIFFAVKNATVIPFCIPARGLLVFEVVLNAPSMFNHSNVAMPPWLDRLLRVAVVTPDMHRVHHSILRRETDSNFGFNLPWWDRLFGTYRAAPEAGHAGMTVGLPIFSQSAGAAHGSPADAAVPRRRCRRAPRGMIAGAITAIFRRPIRRPSRNGARPNGAERAGAKGTGEDSRVHVQHGMVAADPNGSMEDDPWCDCCCLHWASHCYCSIRCRHHSACRSLGMPRRNRTMSCMRSAAAPSSADTDSPACSTIAPRDTAYCRAGLSSARSISVSPAADA